MFNLQETPGKVSKIINTLAQTINWSHAGGNVQYNPSSNSGSQSDLNIYSSHQKAGKKDSDIFMF
jgi:hypothetical protein